MRTTLMIIAVVVSLASEPSFGAVRQLPLPLRGDGAVSALAATDEGGWVAVARGGSSELYRVTEAGLAPAGQVVNGLIKNVRPLRDGALFVSGATRRGGASEPFFRIVSSAGGALTTRWDAQRLPATTRGEESLVEVSPDGKRWAAVVADDARVRVSFGSTASDRVETQMTIDSEPVAMPEGFVYDGVDLKFVNGARNDVALLWRGRVFVIGDGSKIVSRLGSPVGGAYLAFDESSGTLWSAASMSAAAFDLTSAAQQNANGRAVGPLRVVESSTRQPSRFFALSGGRAALATVENGVFRLVMEDAANNRKSVLLDGATDRSIVSISSSGKVKLHLPRGDRSAVLTILTE